MAAADSYFMNRLPKRLTELDIGASGLVDRASAERALYAKWVWPLHSSEEFQRAVCAFVEAFNDAWRDADDDSKTRCEAVVREMLDLERAFTELLSSS